MNYSIFLSMVLMCSFSYAMNPHDFQIEEEKALAEALVVVNIQRIVANKEVIYIKPLSSTKRCIGDICPFTPLYSLKPHSELIKEIQFHEKRAEQPLPHNVQRAKNGLWVRFFNMTDEIRCAFSIEHDGALYYKDEPLITKNNEPLDVSNFAGQEIIVTGISHPYIVIKFHLLFTLNCAILKIKE